MKQHWFEPKFVITLILIGLFAFAYLHDPSDEAMKGALIGAFSAAYGFWIGSKNSDVATENTGKAFQAIEAAAKAGTSDKVQPVKVVNEPEEPVPTTDSEGELPEYAR